MTFGDSGPAACVSTAGIVPIHASLQVDPPQANNRDAAGRFEEVRLSAAPPSRSQPNDLSRVCLRPLTRGRALRS